MVEEDGVPVVKLTERGKAKVLKYNLDDMSLDKKNWNGKWRLIIYDIPKSKTDSAKAFRYMLNKIDCLKLQKSVYLTPFPCEGEIKYLREVFDIGPNVILITVSDIEDEKVYLKHFGLKK